ncbi:CYFA0S07e03235g1_1 [Cyberlindnera fabianii]|uniref:CYFA0S07e03235g1_1 n=1 Tax=Cyberlindnera fabianii TaxID=36022 RepID=A0A061AV97_CYBFA|nr:CYFA0S07e03235g1_1 [Cyberlindnera fabianii]
MTSFLHCCPLEVLINICLQLDDYEDLLSLSLTSTELRGRMGRFIRVLTANGGPPAYFKDFNFCSQDKILSQVPDWSISLIEFEIERTKCSELCDSLRSGLRHVKFYIGVLHQGSRSLFSDNDLCPHIIFNHRVVISTSQRTISIMNTVLENTTIKATNPEGKLYLQMVDYKGRHPIRMAPTAAGLSGCTDRLVRGLCFDRLRELAIDVPVDWDCYSPLSWYTNFAKSDVIVGLSDVSFPMLEHLNVSNIVYLENLNFPSLISFFCHFTSHSPKGNAIPRITNVSMPNVRDFTLQSYHQKPIVDNLSLPETCKRFVMECLPSERCSAIEITDDSKCSMIDIPEGQICTVVKNMAEYVSDSTFCNITSLEVTGDREIARVIGLKNSNILMPSLDSLTIVRDSNSHMALDFNSLAHDFPMISSLTICGARSEDSFNEGIHFPQLERLLLADCDLEVLTEVVKCFKLSHMKKIRIINLDSLTTTVDPSTPTSIIQKLIVSLERVKTYLEVLSIDLSLAEHRLTLESPMRLTGFRRLARLSLGLDITELELIGCYALERISLAGGHTALKRLSADDLPQLERLFYYISRDNYSENDGSGIGPESSIQDICDHIEQFKAYKIIKRDVRLIPPSRAQ